MPKPVSRVSAAVGALALLSGCMGGEEARPNASIQNLTSNTTYLMVMKNANPVCLQSALGKSQAKPVEIAGIFLDTLRLEDYEAGLFLRSRIATRTSGGTARIDLEARVSVTEVTATRVNGSYQFYDSLGVPEGKSEAFSALKCPDYVLDSE